MDRIEKIVYKVIGDISNLPKKQEDLNKIWEEIVGHKGIKHSSLVGYEDNILIVHTDSPAMLFQLNLKKTLMIKRFKEIIPEIKDISFKIGKIDKGTK